LLGGFVFFPFARFKLVAAGVPLLSSDLRASRPRGLTLLLSAFFVLRFSADFFSVVVAGCSLFFLACLAGLGGLSFLPG